jgi:hypothetical protein
MISATRKRCLEKLAALSELAPELRLGQLMENLGSLADGPEQASLWDLDDDKLLQAAEQFEADLRRRAGRVAS